MVFCKTSATICKLRIWNIRIKQVQKLGGGRKCDTENLRPFGISIVTFQNPNEVLRVRKKTWLETKKNALNCDAILISLYASEYWTNFSHENLRSIRKSYLKFLWLGEFDNSWYIKGKRDRRRHWITCPTALRKWMVEHRLTLLRTPKERAMISYLPKDTSNKRPLFQATILCSRTNFIWAWLKAVFFFNAGDTSVMSPNDTER